jgi:UDP-N-acetylmuramoyl-tripeptide--D-alanyl-D-alanine ligase
MRSGPGRIELRRRYNKKLWRMTSPLSRVHRRTLGRRARVVVVVGSVGKTTTMRTVSAALGLRVHPMALANANAHSSVAYALLRITPRTRHAVIEAGIGGPGEMRIYAADTRPDIAVVTAIATDHWPTLHTIERTRDEKADILRALPPTGVAVLNADDPNVRWMASQTQARVNWFGFAAGANVRATNVELDWPHGMSFTIHAAGETHPVHLRLIGRHMVYPALAAVAVALAEGRTLAEAVAAVETVSPGQGKMALLVLPNGGVFLQDDAKGTVATYEAALETLATIPARRKTVVFGEIRQPPLPESATYGDLGLRVAAIADRAIFVGKRFEEYQAGALSGGLAEERITRAADAHEAIEQLRDEVGPTDVVLVKGLWQQRLGRVGLALSGSDVRCRADPCPFKRTMCGECPFLEKDFEGAPSR